MREFVDATGAEVLVYLPYLPRDYHVVKPKIGGGLFRYANLEFTVGLLVAQVPGHGICVLDVGEWWRLNTGQFPLLHEHVPTLEAAIMLAQLGVR